MKANFRASINSDVKLMVDDGIFISYRRDRGSEVARICKEFLEGQGFRVFLDVEGLTNGPFDNQLLEQLDKHGHLLLVCSPGCLDRCSENNDWIRQEVAHAIKLKRNIVPLLLSQFEWPKSETLPEEIRELNRHNAFSYNHEHWDSIKGKFANHFRTGKLAVQTLPERFIQVFMPQLLKLMANRKGDVVPAQTESDFFKVASENLLGGSSQGETRQMLEEIVQHPSKFANAVSAATANQSVDVQDAAKLYFGQVPGTLQQSLRRSGDRTGRTIPNDLPLSKPEDFLRLIPSAMPRFMPGQFPVTGTDLKLIAFLGKGGFGEVWRARHLDRPNDADVVLKFCIDERAARSLIKEVDLLKKIKTKGRHANIVDLLDTHLDCSPPCLEYEFVDGGDLAKLIDDRSMNPLTPKLSPKAVAQIIARIATPVAFAHQQNIVHRDLKPQNVLVRRTQSDLNSVNFKITDFGIGGLIRTEELKQIQTSSVSAGETLSKGTFTPIYSSRQQQQGASPDKRDDVFALGVIWYQLLINDLTKEAPSGGGWKVRLRANGVTDEMLALLEGCIESDLEDRIPDAQILVERLTKIISARPVEPTISQPVIASPVQLSTTSLEWAEILERHPDSAVVGGQFIEKIRATGLPWRVRDKATGIEMLIVPSGIFEMGQSVGEPFNRADELPRHTVRISRPFYLGRYPVTQEEWCRVGKINPSAAKSPRNPVEKISWTDANDYCKQAGLRLPTEAEWEYSCRAGSTGVSYGELEQIGWYSGNSQKLTRQVGMKLANALGFHDMIGLVWEWCSDFYASDYYASCASGVDDPQGPIGGGAHVQRGGSFGNRAVMCRPAVRTSPRTDARLKYHGFRVVREPDAVVAHEVHKKASATPGPTVPSVPPARPARPVAPPPIIRPQKPSSVGTPEQANNNVRAVESASKNESPTPDPKVFWKVFLGCGAFVVLSVLMVFNGNCFIQIVGVISALVWGMGGLSWVYQYWKNRSGSRK